MAWEGINMKETKYDPEGIIPLEEQEEEPTYEEWTEDGCTGGGCRQCIYCDECPTGQMSEY